MFENFQLAEYGNRIPSLSFEIEADEGPVTVGAIARELAGGTLTAGETPALLGHAAGGDSVRGAIEGLARLMDLPLADDGSVLKLGAVAAEPVDIAPDEAGVRTEDGAGGRTEVAKAGAASLPAEISLTYLDPFRDWQTSVQRARIDQVTGHAERTALPAALGAESAKAIAEARLASLWSARSTARLHLGWRRMALRPGTPLRVAGLAGSWRIERWTLRRMVVTADLVRVAATGPAEASASAGRPLREPDLAHGPTIVRLLDIAAANPSAEDGPRLLVAASGPEAGWRRAELSVSYDGGAGWVAAGHTAPPTVMGSAATSLAPAGATRFDAKNSVEVALLNDAMWLEGRDDAALVGGANLALLGQELIQFGRAEPLGDRRFRLSRLLRGRRGTEWAATDHAVGESFVLLEAEALAAIDAPLASLGGEARLMARGLGDETAVFATIPVTGEALRPPAPVRLAAEPRPGGDIALSWVRRSRAGWAWLDGADVPLAEERERYRLRIMTATSLRTATLEETGYLHAAEAQAGDGGGPLTVEVTQLGTFAASRAATITVERS